MTMEMYAKFKQNACKMQKCPKCKSSVNVVQMQNE